MESGCKWVVKGEMVKEFVGDKILDCYYNLLNVVFVLDFLNFRWCLYLDCLYIIGCI